MGLIRQGLHLASLPTAKENQLKTSVSEPKFILNFGPSVYQ